jgi:hypothetical protein
MSKRIAWVLLAAGAAFIAAYWFLGRARPAPAPAPVAKQPMPAAAPAPALVRDQPFLTPSIPALQPPPVGNVRMMQPKKRPDAAAPAQVVPIQDGATIDFSVGAPMVRSGGTDGDALKKGLKDIEDAEKGAVFAPTPATNTPPKK